MMGVLCFVFFFFLVVPEAIFFCVIDNEEME